MDEIQHEAAKKSARTMRKKYTGRSRYVTCQLVTPWAAVHGDVPQHCRSIHHHILRSARAALFDRRVFWSKRHERAAFEARGSLPGPSAAPFTGAFSTNSTLRHRASIRQASRARRVRRGKLRLRLFCSLHHRILRGQRLTSFLQASQASLIRRVKLKFRPFCRSLHAAQSALFNATPRCSKCHERAAFE